MSDIKLFRIGPEGVTALPSSSVAVEKSLQTMIERYLDAFLGVRFVATEHATGKAHGGRIDTLGLDENNCPVIIEYKRALNENVINQGLFYLNWLMDHKAEFKLLVLEKYGKPVADAIEWKQPRLLCIAGDFTKYDEHAVREIPRNIELIRYRRYGDDLLLFELVAATAGESPTWTKALAETGPPRAASEGGAPADTDSDDMVIMQRFHKLPPEAKDRYYALRAFLMALGDDVQERILDRYVAFRRLKSFAYIKFRTQTDRIIVSVNIDPKSLQLESGFTTAERPNVDDTWTLIHVRTDDDLERAKPLILKSYEAS